jgi:hypothetical protein
MQFQDLHVGPANDLSLMNDVVVTEPNTKTIAAIVLKDHISEIGQYAGWCMKRENMTFKIVGQCMKNLEAVAAGCVNFEFHVLRFYLSVAVAYLFTRACLVIALSFLNIYHSL